MEARTKKALCSWSKIRKWFYISTLSRTRAIIVQVTVEVTLLFDSHTKAWTITECNKLQSIVDKCYRTCIKIISRVPRNHQWYCVMIGCSELKLKPKQLERSTSSLLSKQWIWAKYICRV